MDKRKRPRKPRLLVGWNRIAAYLECSVATAKRRETEGMPLVRVGGAVCALADEVEVWLKSKHAHGRGARRR